MEHYGFNETIVNFARILKKEGLKINQAQSLRAMLVLNEISLINKTEFYYALRSVFCFSPEDYKIFDRIFRGFWGEQVPYAGTEHAIEDEEESHENEPDIEELGLEQDSSAVNSSGQQDQQFLLQEDLSEELEQAGRMFSYSPDEKLLLKQYSSIPMKDFADFRTEWNTLLALLMKTMRKDSTIRGRQELVLKKMLRKNLTQGAGELFQLYRKGKRKTDKQILYTLVDISGSMEVYIKMYLPIFYLLQRYAGRAETYFFNTSIYPVTKYFKQRYGNTLEMLNERLRVSANGTNLGQCMSEFWKTQSSKLSPQLTTIIIFSDGWDRGDMEQLAHQIKKIHTQVYQIIWINPLLGLEGYYPHTQAFNTVIPYISHMVSLKDIKSIKQGPRMKWRVR
ncbi:VWA domain-containing protein [Peribacillus saganii]|uniref:VWA domain-containing protein n=1 Tax=Peribacillus saganii TaxID=2303992 RepID=A0A372LQK7_9BACI|nr:VWA domain-containing protein [Peribacillus saganii]RFU70488.1 VWA domain-containing protein [Peribacillus saganii]